MHRERNSWWYFVLLVFLHPVPCVLFFSHLDDGSAALHSPERSVPGERKEGGHKWRSYAPKTQGRRQCRVPQEWEGVRAACRVSPSHFAKRTLGGWLCGIVSHPWHMQPPSSSCTHPLSIYVVVISLWLYFPAATTTWPSSSLFPFVMAHTQHLIASALKKKRRAHLPPPVFFLLLLPKVFSFLVFFVCVC